MLILARPVMVYSVDVARACDTQSEWDFQDLARAEGNPFEDIHLIRNAGLHGPDPDLHAATAPTYPEEMISRILGDGSLKWPQRALTQTK